MCLVFWILNTIRMNVFCPPLMVIDRLLILNSLRLLFKKLVTQKLILSLTMLFIHFLLTMLFIHFLSFFAYLTVSKKIVKCAIRTKFFNNILDSEKAPNYALSKYININHIESYVKIKESIGEVRLSLRSITINSMIIFKYMSHNYRAKHSVCINLTFNTAKAENLILRPFVRFQFVVIIIRMNQIVHVRKEK